MREIIKYENGRISRNRIMSRWKYEIGQEIRMSTIEQCFSSCRELTEKEFVHKNVCETYNYGKCPTCTKVPEEYYPKMILGSIV